MRRIGWGKLGLLVAMSVFGLWASSMVVVVYYTLRQTLPACVLPPPGNGIAINCGTVLQSGYSSVFGVPLEFFAVAYFLVNLALIYLASFGSDRLSKTSLRTLFVWRFLGLAIVPYLVAVEVFVLRAICLYCTMMHVAIVVDFFIISYLLFYKRGTLTDGRTREG